MGNTPLLEAAFADQFEIVNLLLKQPGIDPNVVNHQGVNLQSLIERKKPGVTSQDGIVALHKIEMTLRLSR
jgi:ankyrin repeat protein